MVQVAICEDDSQLLGWMKKIIGENTDSRAAYFTLGEEILRDERKFDIYVLDIDIGDMKGMEVARRIREHSDAILIFLTQRQDYVSDAFDLEAFHYLVKPIQEEKLREVYGRAVEEIENRRRKEPLLIKVKGVYRSIPVGDILYAENMGRKIVLHLKGEQVEYYARMEDLENALGSQFYRCHRGYLVNLQEIAGYDVGSILLTSKEEILMAKQKYNGFVDAYRKFLRKRQL